MKNVTYKTARYQMKPGTRRGYLIEVTATDGTTVPCAIYENEREWGLDHLASGFAIPGMSAKTRRLVKDKVEAMGAALADKILGYVSRAKPKTLNPEFQHRKAADAR